MSGKYEDSPQIAYQSFCGITRVERNVSSSTNNPRRCYAPQRNFNPVNASSYGTSKQHNNHKAQSMLSLGGNQFKDSQERCVTVSKQYLFPPKLDVTVNRLRKSLQISRVVYNFEQRFKSSSGLATTSILMRPEPRMFATMSHWLSIPTNNLSF